MFTQNKVSVTANPDESTIEFTISDSTVEFANGLRRCMIADVPTLAIDIVTVQENNSCLPDELIVHRLGLLPVDSSKASEMLSRQDCPCNDVCPQCAALFELNVSCGHDYNGTMEVTQDDVKPVCMPGMETNSIQLVQPPEGFNISILKLRQGQSVKMRMTAYKGNGKLHAKWSPVATACFRYEPIIRLLPSIQNLNGATKREIADVCHQEVYRVDRASSAADAAMFLGDDLGENQDDGDLIINDASRCDFCGECEKVLVDHGLRGAIEVTTKPGVFHFTVESTGVLSAKDCVRNAISVLVEKFSVLRNECQNLPANERQHAQRQKQSAGMVTQSSGMQSEFNHPVDHFALDLS
eukprot:GHVH01016145.1.p2 GENE.GHVH01016145.1~~GHVH01016145.1.p2  ORF type:complete len:354 (-),score=40.65 GHVH01016145.1:2108-3169(-)